MKKVLFFIVLLSVVSFALVDAIIPHVFSPNTPARAAEVNKNFDSLKVATNRLIDSLDANFVRNIDFDSATSLNKAFIDTITANKIYTKLLIGDSVHIKDGTAILDSAYSVKVNTETATIANGTITTISGTTATYDTIQSRAFSGSKIDVDSIVNLGITTVTGNIDTINADKITASVSAIGTATATTINTGFGANELYPMNQSVLTTADVIFDSIAATKGVFSSTLSSATLNTGNGDNELYAMNQSVRTNDDVVFDSMVVTKLGVLTATYFPSINTGHGDNELYPMNQGVLTTSNVIFDSIAATKIVVSTSSSLGAATATTLNTGNGANELYAMNQDVETTDDVTFDDLTIDTIYQRVNKTYASVADSSLYYKTPTNTFLLSAIKKPSAAAYQIDNNANAAAQFLLSNTTDGTGSFCDIGSKYSSTLQTLIGVGAPGNSSATYAGRSYLYSNSASDLFIIPQGTASASFNGGGTERSLTMFNGTATTPSGGAKLYASGGQLYAKDTTGDTYNLTPLEKSFTATLTGMTSATTGTVYYTFNNNMATLYVRGGGIIGTSNTTSLSMTGIPSEIRPPTNRDIIVSNGSVADNGLPTYTIGTATAAGVINFAKMEVSGSAIVAGSFTNSGQKGLINCTIMYPLK